MNNIYEELNKVTIEADKENEMMDDQEQQQYFKQFKKSTAPVKKNKRKITGYIAAAAIAMSTLAFTNEDVQAGVESILDKVSFSLPDQLTPHGAEYAKHINETITLGKVNVKLTDVIVEKDYVTLNLLYDLPANAELTDQDVDISANNLHGNSYFGSIGQVDKKNNIYAQTETVKLNQPLEKNKVDVKIIVNHLQYRLNDETTSEKKKATYQFTADRQKLAKATKHYEFNKKQRLNNIPVTLKDITINPVTARMNITFGQTAQVNTMLVDDKGKQYIFTPNIVYHKVTSTDLMLSLDNFQSTGNIDDLNKGTHFKLYILDDATDQMNPDDENAIDIALK